MIFVDTSAWYALYSASDYNNQSAREWMRANPDNALVTTDYVVDELLTLLTTRKNRRHALKAGYDLLSGKTALLEFITPVDFDAAWKLFQSYADKQWSFTDCTSRVVMDRMGIETAFAFDEHFRQFGTVSVVP